MLLCLAYARSNNPVTAKHRIDRTSLYIDIIPLIWYYLTMKRIGLTEKELDVLETALIEYGSVVTFDQLTNLLNENREYSRKRVSRLSKQGWLKRVKKGVFVISDLSTRGTLSISPNAVVNLLVQEAYISFEAALQHHGIYDQLMTNINSVSLKRYKSTRIDGFTYTFIKTKRQYFYGWDIHDIDGQSVKIASIEKAIIDLLQFHRRRYSTDLVLDKLASFENDIDFQKLIDLAGKANLTTQRILGFLMDLLNLDSNQIHRAVLNRQSVSSISKAENNLYNHKWKLYYDQHFTKYAQEKINQTAA